ncbi:MAG: UDP-2,3-diacylglucosamine diphosphatase [Muribaculaceae bacterium]|nr:UDP-2,3-diacylglucosamine diphosphatase [Muribaculaceae bacterium]
METKRSKTYFVADIHLGASYIADPSAHERRFVSFLESIAGDAARIYLLGDILDYHFEYKNAIPARCLRTIGLLGRLADRGIDIVWIAGNHDTWFRGTLARELGITTTTDTVVDTVIGGRRFVLTHGDAVGPVSRKYLALRAVLRNPVARFLYAAVHPRWTTALALACSRLSRKSQGGPAPTPWQGDDREPIYQYAVRLASDPVTAPDYIIAGHRHLPVDRIIPGTATRLVILGDGYREINYAVFDGTELTTAVYTL